MRAGSILGAAALALAGCVTATETSRTTRPVAIESLNTQSAPLTYTLAVGAFQNRSPYLQGAFAEGVDPLGRQARSLLEIHLRLSNRFVIAGQAAGAPVTITGDVTQFGRRETGGVLGVGRKPVAYATVALQVVDASIAQVTYVVEGAGEYPLTDREMTGFGTAADYDPSVNGKVLNRAILQAVDNLVAGLDRGEWLPTRSSLRGR